MTDWKMTDCRVRIKHLTDLFPTYTVYLHFPLAFNSKIIRIISYMQGIELTSFPPASKSFRFRYTHASWAGATANWAHAATSASRGYSPDTAPMPLTHPCRFWDMPLRPHLVGRVVGGVA